MINYIFGRSQNQYNKLIITHYRSMRMDYYRDASYNPNQRVSTQEIKAGLERIKRAQQQVLEQLKKNSDPNTQIRSVSSQIFYDKNTEQDSLKRELNLEREKSQEKSTLYRRRVVDLESSLKVHMENEDKLTAKVAQLEQEVRLQKQKYRQLEKEYKKIQVQCQNLSRNIRSAQRRAIEVESLHEDEELTKIRTNLEQLGNERNALMSQKVSLLKANSKLETQNVELKKKIALSSSLSSNQKTNNNHKKSQSQKSQQKFSFLQGDQKNDILNSIHKMNSAHETIFGILKSNVKLSHGVIQKENMYQNSLNKMLQILARQKGEPISNIDYKFGNESSFRQELERRDSESGKKMRKEQTKLQSQSEELQRRLKQKDKQISEAIEEKQGLQEKILKIQKQKMELVSELAEKGKIIQKQKEKFETEKRKFQQQLEKRRAKDKEYQTMIQELNEQMALIHRQRRDVEGLINKVNVNSCHESSKGQEGEKRRLKQAEQQNNRLKDELWKLKRKHEQVCMQKDTIFMDLKENQNRNNSLNKQIAKEIFQKQHSMNELNRYKGEIEMLYIENERLKLQMEKLKLQCQQVNHSYLKELERLIAESLQMRGQIESLNHDRKELRDLKNRFGLLVRDNQILSKKTRFVNGQVDHLWMIKQVEYQNLNKILVEMKPL